MKRPDKTTPSQNEKATPPSQSSETDFPQSKYILKSPQLTPQEWQGVMKRLRKEGTAEELLQILRISIALSQDFSPEERTEAAHFFTIELMKLAREGKVIKPPILSPDFTREQIRPRLAVLEARHPRFSKLWEEKRFNDLHSHKAGEPLRPINLDAGAYIALKQRLELLSENLDEQVAGPHSAPLPRNQPPTEKKLVSLISRKGKKPDAQIANRNTLIAALKNSYSNFVGNGRNRRIAQALDEQRCQPPKKWDVPTFQAALKNPKLRKNFNQMVAKADSD